MAHHFTDILNSFSDSDPNMGLIRNYFPQLSPVELHSSTWSIQSIMGFSHDSLLFTQAAEIHANKSQNLEDILPTIEKSVAFAASEPIVPSVSDHFHHVGKKGKSIDTPQSSSANSSPPASENGIDPKIIGGKGKKLKYNGKDVVHVRSRRGQATDSHSLAEKIRRGKINERLRCLQNLVPGCHKTVGMAVLLDEVINYVQSLQNQVEFLSMKLTAASAFHNFDLERDAMSISLQREKACEAAMIQKRLKERCELGDGGFTLPSTQHGPFDLSFGSYPWLPYNK